jgi:glycosyltransferase involved in cell wall biosynthesis
LVWPPEANQEEGELDHLTAGLLSESNSRRTRAANRPLNIVLVDEELPYPPNSGKRSRTLNLTLRLARRHRITYVCHRNADPNEARRAEVFFARHGIETRVVERTVPRKSGPVFWCRLAGNLLSPLPYSVVTHTSRGLRRALKCIATENTVDLWHCEWTPYVASLKGLQGPRVVVAHNVESVIWRRYAATEPGALRRWYILSQCRKWESFERKTLRDVQRTVTVSDLDAARLRDDFGVRAIDVVENGVDTMYFQPQTVRREPRRLLFLGSLDWRPNLDAVSVLLDRVFPEVRTHERSARLSLVGRNPPAWLVRRAAAEPGVELHANVPDVRPYLASCGMMVVPLRVGGGSRLKILEALACGTPVVSTRIGAEGLSLQAGRHLTVVEGIEDLAPALATAILSPRPAVQQAERGRQEVVRLYDWDTLAERLDAVWRDVAGGTDRPRD